MERHTDRGWFGAVVLCLGGFLVGLAPQSALAAGCTGGGVGLACTKSECAGNSRATTCVAKACAIPCVDDTGKADPGKCGVGEVCGLVDVYGTTAQTHVCKSVPMVMDLNLLDTCIYQFVKGPEGVNPTGTSECSAHELLTRMLDRDANGLFNIFDVDGCIADFLDLYAMPCDEATQSCHNGQVYCDFDEDCGTGSYCDEELLFCRRECGFIVDRGEPGVNKPVVLDRPCSGRLKTCDYSLGKCVKVDLETCPPEAPDCHACQVDAQCPNGSYCFVGKCTAKCNSALDCPDASWYCSNTNTCLPRPREGAASATFNPKNYSLLLTEREVSFSVTQKSLDVPVLIMDLKERKPVFDNANVVFGYRLETKYGRKQDPVCLGDLTGKPQTVIDDCLISADEEFITMENPFGVIYGDGDPQFRLALNMMAFEKLTPGLYQASFTAMFNNGDMDTIKVLVRKPTPSGEYFGQLAVYLDNKDNLLGQGNVGAKLYVAVNEPMVEWDKLLEQNNLLADKEYEDVTRGYPVRGTIHGRVGMLFDKPLAKTPGENEVQVKGIYSPHLGRMRLIAVIDVPQTYCMTSDGSNCIENSNQLQVKNRFGRRVQRIAEFIGPFDPLEGLFHGAYRETVSGLVDWDITLSGDFRLALMTQEATDISLTPLRSANVAVGFPNDAAVAARINGEVDAYCTVEDKAKFADSDAFSTYLNGYPSARVYPQLAEMTGLIGNALTTLNGNPKAYLTLNEFLAGKAGFCTFGGSASSCVDKKAVLCGLALYRKAFVANDWVDMGNVGSDAHSLFCDENSSVPNCRSKNPTVATLHEHNRFYQQLVQTYAYEAGNALSDAFYVMYKAAAKSKLDAATAYDHKVLKLGQALAKYDEVRSALYSPEATKAMLGWPMASFNGKGNDWLDYLEVASTDRMTTILELLDLKRRVQDTLDVRAEAFASHLLHDEYLVQVMLLALRQHWQGEQMTYTGTGPRMMEQGEIVLAKVSQARNPLGLHDNRVFFENSDLQVNNWQNYRDRVGKTLTDLDAATGQAILDLRASLNDQDNLENSLQTLAHEAQRQIDDLCGPDSAYSQEGCDAVTEEERKQQLTCDPELEDGCTATWVCDQSSGSSEKDCDTPAKVFDEGVSVVDQACRVDTVKMELKFAGSQRQCVRGRMGALIQEGKSLQLQKDAVMRRFDLLMRQIAREQQYIADVSNANNALLTEMETQKKATARVMDEMKSAEIAWGAAQDVFNALSGGDFTLATFVASGAVVMGVARGFYTNYMSEAKIELENIQADAAAFRTQHESDKEALILRKNLDDLMDQVEVLLIDYDSVVQQIANVSLQMDDTLYLARQASKRHEEVVSSIVNHLVGRESGSVLTRNKMVVTSNVKFQEVLVETYKMAQAFIHRYNKGSQSRSLVNRVYRLQTATDIREFIAELEKAERDYCGASAVDCDSVNNTKIYRLSLRDTLFPSLRDIVDAKSGKVLTKGQQFHNIITSSPQFVRRFNRATGVRTQVVLPFTIWMHNLGSATNPHYMVNGEECNHVLVGKRNNGSISAGTIAVNVVGSRVTYPVEYELWRGNTDYLRSCTDKDSPVEPKVNIYTVGYASQSVYGKMDVPPDFITHSTAFPACTNNTRLDDPNQQSNEDSCFNYYGRDRSLGAPDWKVVIPNLDLARSGGGSNGGQKWLLGDGLKEDEKPLIEDIVLYFRYNAQPIVTQ